MSSSSERPNLLPSLSNLRNAVVMNKRIAGVRTGLNNGGERKNMEKRRRGRRRRKWS